MMDTVTLSLVLLLPLVALATSNKCELTYHPVQSQTVANCSFRNLSDIPHDLPSNISILYLNDNHMTELGRDSFIQYPHLGHLLLFTNKIRKLNGDASAGLTDLYQLELNNNMLFLDKSTYPWNIFHPLPNLRTLFMHYNLPSNGDFPDNIFESLSSLEELRIDTWPLHANSSGMSKLYSLKHLEIIGHNGCDSQVLHNDSFTVLQNSSVEYLRMICTFTYIETCVFCPLKNLTNIAIGVTYMSTLVLKTLTKAFHPFVGRSMYEMSFLALQDTAMDIGHNGVIGLKELSYLSDVCLKRLRLRQNRISRIKHDVLTNSTLCQCLEYLDLSFNNIKGNIGTIFRLPFLQELRFIDLSDNKPFHPISQNIGLVEDVNKRAAIFLPPKLEKVLFRHGPATHSYDNIRFFNGNNVKFLDISGLRHGDKPVVGYLNGLTNLSELVISDNIFGATFFNSSDFVTSLEVLRCRNCLFQFDSMGSLYFFRMTNLRFLDLSNTDIQVVQPGTFSKLEKLEYLDISLNKLDNIPREITKISTIKGLDMASNRLSSISRQEMNILDELATNGFMLNLSGNIFICGCASLDVIVWLQETKVTLGNHGKYKCLTNEGIMTDTLSFYEEYLCHWRQCTGQICFTFSIASFLLFTLAIVITFIIKKYSPVIEHYVLQMLGYKGKPHPVRKDFKHDAYICYDTADYQWPCHRLLKELQHLDRKIRLYVPDLHDLPGESKAESIIEAISDSWKVVVVISEKSFTDEWFYFAIVSAVRLFSSHNAITNRIILLYRDMSPRAKVGVPQLLLNVVPEANVINVTDDDVFWRRLYWNIVTDQGPDDMF